MNEIYSVKSNIQIDDDRVKHNTNLIKSRNEENILFIVNSSPHRAQEKVYYCDLCQTSRFICF